MNHKSILPLFVAAFLSLNNLSYGGPVYSVTNPNVSQINVPAKRLMTILTFVQPGSDPTAERTRIVATKDGGSVTVRVANLAYVLNETFSGQIYIAGPATVDIIGPTAFLTYKLQPN
jgi:spore maturation protein SpmB